MMTKKKTESTQDTRRRILDAAAAVFAEIGYAAARVDEIAERAGTNKAMLYYHVGDKQQLYTTVFAETLDAVAAELHRVVAAPLSSGARMEAIIATLARRGTENRLFVPMVLREIASGGTNLTDEMILKMAGVFRLVAGVLAEGTAAGEFRTVHPLLTHVAIVGGTMFMVASEPVRRRVAAISGVPAARAVPDDPAAHLSALFLHGLQSPPAPAKRLPVRKAKR